MAKAFATLLAFGLVVAIGTAASATLIGDTITIESTANIPVDNWTDSVLVGDGIELTAGDGHNHSLPGPGFAHLFTTGDSYDIGANSITINFVPLGPTFGFPYAFISVFSDFQWTDMPGSLQSVSVAAGATGLVASNISAVHAEGFTFQGTVDLVNGANFTLELTAVHAVPAPGCLPMLAVGLLGLRIGIRRKRLA